MSPLPDPETDSEKKPSNDRARCYGPLCKRVAKEFGLCLAHKAQSDRGEALEPLPEVASTIPDARRVVKLKRKRKPVHEAAYLKACAKLGIPTPEAKRAEREEDAIEQTKIDRKRKNLERQFKSGGVVTLGVQVLPQWVPYLAPRPGESSTEYGLRMLQDGAKYQALEPYLKEAIDLIRSNSDKDRSAGLALLERIAEETDRWFHQK